MRGGRRDRRKQLRKENQRRYSDKSKLPSAEKSGKIGKHNIYATNREKIRVCGIHINGNKVFKMYVTSAMIMLKVTITI